MPLVRTLHDIASSLESADAPQGRIRHVLGLLREIVAYDQCALLEVQVGAEDRLSLVAEPSPHELAALGQALRLLFTRVSEDRYVPRHGDAPATRALMPWKSHLAVPLVGLDQVIGLLFVGQVGVDKYTESDLSLVSLVAAQLAAYLTAIREQSARIAAEASAGRLHALLTVTDAALTHLDVDELLEEVLGHVRGALEADAAATLLLTEDGQHLVEYASVGLPPELQGMRIPIAVGQPQTGVDRLPLNLEDLSGLEVACAPFRQRLRSLLGAALFAQGRLLGIMLVGALEPGRFAEDDARLLQLVCDRIALPLEHGRLFAEEQQARARAELVQRRLTLLAEVTTSLTASLDYEGALQSVARLMVASLADLCIVDVADEDGVSRPAAMAHCDPVAEEQVRESRAHYTVRLNSAHPLADVLRAGRPVVYSTIPGPLLQSMTGTAERPRAQRAGDLQSALVVPLTARGRTLGTITFASSTSGRYGPTDLTLAEEVARRVALAVDNGRLYREARLAEARYHRLLTKGLQVPPHGAATAGASAAGPLESDADAATSQPVALLEHWLSTLPMSPLTPRERQVLDALVAGASTQEISQLLVVSQYAVRYHLKNLFRKFHVRRRSQLVASAVRLGLTSQTGQALTAPTTPSG